VAAYANVWSSINIVYYELDAQAFRSSNQLSVSYDVSEQLDPHGNHRRNALKHIGR
jgi:hypothetical protein